MEFDQEPAINVSGEALLPCGAESAAGFFRDGYCNTCTEDLGSHTVCVELTQQFLEFSRFRGNDLMTPIPEFDFPGLKAGDYWCLCAARWLEAQQHDRAPHVFLQRTHQKALEIIPRDVLFEHAIDLN